MIFRKPFLREILMLRGIANYQFGYPYGEKLIPDNITVSVSPTTGRIRNIYYGNEIIVTLRPLDFLFSLHMLGGEILRRNSPKPMFRVVVREDVVDFVSEGRDVFAKHVIEVDPEIRAGAEVIVVDRDDNLLAVGRAKLSSHEMLSFKRGIAVRVRHAKRK